MAKFWKYIIDSIIATTKVEYPTQEELLAREFARIEKLAQERLQPKLHALYLKHCPHARMQCQMPSGRSCTFPNCICGQRGA
jgi:hypothetical protein